MKERRVIMMSVKQKEKLKSCKTSEDVVNFMNEEKIKLTEEQIRAVVGGNDDPATYLPEIFDEDEDN
ncbi:MAG: hypothetical protein IIY55_13450 [Blautia sp.]|nr:hypothetical protein [Blautia sp.]